MSDKEAAIHPGQWRLSRIQLVNWGTFDGVLDVPVSREGFLITGGSGSGKSTLIDAISAVLIPSDRVRFNAAAQHEAKRGRGRDLVSYIRGAWRSREDDATGAVISEYLRPKATYSIIVLTFANGTGHHRSLVALFYLRAGANARSDVSKLFGVFPDADIDAPSFQQFVNRGINKRAIKAEFKSATFSENHSAFAAKFRPLLGISSVEAQLLLQRTQSAKSLDNLDQLFREFMLTEPDTFEFADNAVEQFSELESAYERVQDVKAQVELLSPLEKLYRQACDSTEQLQRIQQLEEALPTVESGLRKEKLLESLTAAEVHRDDLKSKHANAAQQVAFAEENYASAVRTLHDSDGGVNEVLQMKLSHHQEELERRKLTRENLHRDLGKVTDVEPDSQEVFTELVNSARITIDAFEKTSRRLEQEQTELAVATDKAKQHCDELSLELAALASSKSNIDARFQNLRRAICAEFNIPISHLPFVGELIDVSPNASEWEPVIQRQLGGFATELLVPARYHHEVAEYINGRHINMRLKFNSIDATFEPRVVRTEATSLVRKVTVVEHEFRNWLQAELAQRFNFQCVKTLAQLSQLDPKQKGVTIDGLVRFASASEKGTTKYEKNDYHVLGDQRQYRLGSTNQQKIEHLQKQHQLAAKQYKAHMQKAQLLRAQLTTEQQRLTIAHRIVDTDWESIDVSSVAAHIEDIRKQILRLSSTPEVQALTAEVERTQTVLNKSKEKEREIFAELSVAKNKVAEFQIQVTAEDETEVEEISDELKATILSAYGTLTRRVTLDNIERLTRKISADFTAQYKTHTNRLNNANNAISGILSKYIEGWPSERADLQATPEYAPDAIAKLHQLMGERLAEFSDRFRTLINDMSTRNLADIANRLRRAQSEIKQRIMPVNASLATSEFAEDRFLRIDVRDTRGEVVTKFQADLETAISGGLGSSESDHAAEQRYQNIAEIIRKLSSKESSDLRWKRAVLDTRRHVSFVGCEIDNNGQVLNTYVDSSSLSGGQAQKLVFFCLAAALRYQLATTDAKVPEYATVILDEAFDRADPTYTKRAMDIFEAFGFHMILATPLKLIRTLSRYVGNTVVVSYEESQTPEGITKGCSMVSHIDITKVRPHHG